MEKKRFASIERKQVRVAMKVFPVYDKLPVGCTGIVGWYILLFDIIYYFTLKIGARKKKDVYQKTSWIRGPVKRGIKYGYL